MEEADREDSPPVTLTGKATSSSGRVISQAIINEIFKSNETGPLWTKSLPNAIVSDNAIIAAGGNSIFLGSKDHISRLDEATGKIIWEKEIRGYTGNNRDSLEFDGKALLQLKNSGDGIDRCIVLDGATGNEKWRNELFPHDTLLLNDKGEIFIRHARGFSIHDGSDGSTKGSVTMQISEDESYVAVIGAMPDGSVFASTTENLCHLSREGKILWSSKGPALSDFLITGGSIVYKDSGGTLIRKDAVSGKTIWKSDERDLKIIAHTDREIYARSPQFTLFCIDMAFGSDRWQVPGDFTLFSSLQALGDDGTPFVARGSRIEALDPATGRPKWSTELRSDELERYSSAVVRQNSLFLSARERFCAVDTRSGEILRELRMKNAISQFAVTDGGNILIQVRPSLLGITSPSDLHCYSSDFTIPSPRSQSADEGDAGVVIDEEWVTIDGVKLPKKKEKLQP
ncbi:MAG: PQQ-binding-like beta-propeller repeat protein [Candidatus Eremiobacteraeota bacterium]|nr:PQQ-binding-like beta-propeller repeat protein [Candidatus Eremiobacteraeota bacterium]